MRFFVVARRMKGLNAHDLGLKFVVGHDGLVLNPGFVRVNGFDRIIEDLGNLFGLFDAHPHEGKNAQVGIEQFIFLQPDLTILAQQGIDKRHKIGKQLKKDPVKALQQFFLFLARVDIAQHVPDFIEFSVPPVWLRWCFSICPAGQNIRSPG